MNSIKKSTIALVAIAILGTVALPVMADNDKRHESLSVRIENSVQKNAFRIFGGLAGDIIGRGESGDNVPALGVNLLGKTESFKSARNEYNQAIRLANSTFNTAKQAAKSRFISAINSANNQALRISALKTYLSDLLVAIKQRSSAKEAALQKYIDALSGIQINNAPTASSQSITVNKNTAKTITLVASDPEGSAMSFSITTNPAHGTLTGTAPNLTYTPSTNFTGTDSFKFRVNDGSLNSNIATISITVTHINQAPTATAQTVTVAKNTAKAITLAGTDPEGSTLSFFVVTNPVHGTLSGTTPNLTYLPATDFTGTDSFTFKASDESLDSAPATVSITVN